MGANEMKIKIGADVSQGVAGINAFNKAMQNVGPNAQKATAALGRLNPGANQASNALTNLGRIAQDANYGFIGIANNINPAIESFQRLKAETGSTGAALKALVAGLSGPAGLAFGVSILTSVLTSFAMSSGNAAAELTGFAKAQSEANKEAGEDIAKLKTLTQIASNHSLTIKTRNDAVDEAVKLGKEYNVTLTREKLLTGEAIKQTNELIGAIKARAEARAKENYVAKLATDNLDREQQILRIEKEREKIQANITALAARQKSIPGAPQSTPEIAIQKSFVQGADEQIQALRKEITDTNTEMEDLIKTITKPGKTDGGNADPLKQRIDALKQLRTDAGLTRAQLIDLVSLEIKLASRDAVKLGFTTQELKERIEGIIESNFPVRGFEFKIEPNVKISKDKLIGDIDISKALNLDKVDIKKFQPIIDNMKAVGAAARTAFDATQLQETAKILTDTLAPAFTSFFNSIIIDGQNVFTSFGNMIKHLVQQIAAAVAKAVALAAITSLIFPAAKGGLSFLGAFKAILGKGFAEGGVATGPKSGYLALLHGTELIIPQHKIGRANTGGVSGLGSVQFAPISITIPGQQLRILLDRVDRQNNRLL